MARLTVDFFSRSLGISTHMNVLLPEGTGGKPVKTLYLLHGSGDDCSAWLRNTSVERYVMMEKFVAEKNLAVVMPGTYKYWYSDCHGGKYFEFVSEELPKIARDLFPQLSAKREDTFVCGNSMGGYGAFKCAFAHPETFGYAASLSGALDIRVVKMWPEVVYLLDNKIEGSENDIFPLAEKLIRSGVQLPKLYQWCGYDDFLYKDNLASNEILKNLGFDILAEWSEGNHSWACWDNKIQRVLDWLPIK